MFAIVHAGRRHPHSISRETRDRRRSESKESSRHGRHRDRSAESRHRRSSSQKRKHSRSRCWKTHLSCFINYRVYMPDFIKCSASAVACHLFHCRSYSGLCPITGYLLCTLAVVVVFLSHVSFALRFSLSTTDLNVRKRIVRKFAGYITFPSQLTSHTMSELYASF